MRSRIAALLSFAALAAASGAATAGPDASSRFQQPGPVDRAVALCTMQVGDAQTCEGMIYSGTQAGLLWLAKGAAASIAGSQVYSSEKDPVRRAVIACNAYVGDMQTCEAAVLSGTRDGKAWLANEYAEALAKTPVYKSETNPIRRAAILCNAHVGDMQTCEGIVISGIDDIWLETAKRN